VRRLVLTVATALLVSGCMLRISTDPFTNPTSQHRTQVEPDTFSFGSTIVSTFQSGRFFDGGASDIGWATSTDGGSHWTEGFLPGITKYHGSGPYDRASDPSVAYDARHGVWVISSLGLLDSPGGPAGRAVVVSRSTDGGLTWGKTPASVATGTFLDKNWTVCDNAPASVSYGHCYTEYDDVSAGDRLHMATSTNGGLTWSQAAVPAVSGLAGQPVVKPNGTVIVPYLTTGGAIAALRSINGGTSYTGPVTIASVAQHRVAGNLRAGSLPTAEVDAGGKTYVAWSDCRYRTSCAVNDIVMSTSIDGVSWSPVTRVPIDPTTSTVDHFIPGLGVDKTTSGASAHLALTYYYYPNASCTTSSCQLDVGFISSTNGGTSWSPAQQLAGPMSLSWLANTNQGAMVGDYISTSISGGKAFPVVALANAPSDGTLDEAMYTFEGGVAVSGGTTWDTGSPTVTAPFAPPAPKLATRY
jgi:hypothetical protein